MWSRKCYSVEWIEWIDLRCLRIKQYQHLAKFSLANLTKTKHNEKKINSEKPRKSKYILHSRFIDCLSAKSSIKGQVYTLFSSAQKGRNIQMNRRNRLDKVSIQLPRSPPYKHVYSMIFMYLGYLLIYAGNHLICIFRVLVRRYCSSRKTKKTLKTAPISNFQPFIALKLWGRLASARAN